MPTFVKLVPAGAEQASILANLLELYAHDFSEFLELELGADGRFGYQHLSTYWSEPGRHPFLVEIDGKWAGLVLVKKKSSLFSDLAVWDMAEFFIVRKHRRRGAGTEITRQIWRRFPGRWEVRVLQSNRAALQFWERAVSSFVGETVLPLIVDKDFQCWHVLTFESKPESDGRL